MQHLPCMEETTTKMSNFKISSRGFNDSVPTKSERCCDDRENVRDMVQDDMQGSLNVISRSYDLRIMKYGIKRSPKEQASQQTLCGANQYTHTTYSPRKEASHHTKQCLAEHLEALIGGEHSLDHTAHVCEVAVHSMIESLAEDRIRRGPRINPGWREPAKVVDVSSLDLGIILVHWHSHEVGTQTHTSCGAAPRDLGVSLPRTRDYIPGAGIRKAGLPGPMRHRDSKGLMLYWPRGTQNL
eukprot:2911816-Amphidinium_carterae.2